ncbi:hypothetical protein [Rhizobium sp. C4]|uniref:hypothetical protein n=1 Tax=Rhizobium sp. C4 TaxID=1349800 RepID=UPI001E6087D0|nr:hypothetical protein [Rhizobium sp. C4]MCD2173636.1 hypothetical protein [Rhizobium sp. C4]
MNTSLKIIYAAAILLPVAAGAHAADYSAEAAATKAYYEKAAPVFKQLGPEAAIKEFNTPKKWYEDKYGLHVTVTLKDSTLVADSGFPELVGMKWNEVSDLDGNALGPFVAKAVEKSPNGAVVQLRFAVPNSSHAGHAEGYCAQIDAEHLLCGWTEVEER